MASEKLLATAKVGKTHALKGFVRIDSLSGEYDHLTKLDKAVVKTKDGKEVCLEVEDSYFHADSFLMKFKGYDSPEKARFLSGGIMYISRDKAPVLREGEYYIADLYNLKMILSDSTFVGTVVGTSEGAQSVLLHVQNSNNRTFLVPNMKPYIGKIDFENGTIELLMKELSE